jgi:hypothetical protein
MVSLRDSFKFEVSSVKQQRPGPRDRGLKDVGRACRAAALRAGATPDQAGGRLYEESKRAKRTQFGPGRRRTPEAKCAKRTQFALGRRRLMEEIVQNEAKLRGIGVCGQRQLPCGAWLGRRVKRAKRTQLRGPEAHDCGLVIADW